MIVSEHKAINESSNKADRSSRKNLETVQPGRSRKRANTEASRLPEGRSKSRVKKKQGNGTRKRECGHRISTGQATSEANDQRWKAYQSHVGTVCAVNDLLECLALEVPKEQHTEHQSK